MTCSTLLTYNNSSPAVAAGGVIPLGSAIHGFGKNINLSNNSIVVSGNGYYNMDVNASVTVTGTGAVTLNLLENGNTVASATATPAEAGASVNFSIPWMIRKTGCACVDKTYTLTLSAAGTVTNLITRTERI